MSAVKCFLEGLAVVVGVLGIFSGIVYLCVKFKTFGRVVAWSYGIALFCFVVWMTGKLICQVKP